MKINKCLQAVLITLIIISLMAVPGIYAAVYSGEGNPFTGTVWAVIPPLLAIILALITKEVYSSLFIGIVLGGCLAADFHGLKVIDTITKDGLVAAVNGTAGIFVFLVILGIMVALINRTGAAASFGQWAHKHVKSRTGAILATFVLGVLIFIDDYFNCLTVGSVMQPVADAKRISRAKLAYIIDATAAPVCMIAPVSSWAAAVSQYADGTGYSGLEMFIRAIPYNFYSLLTLLFIILITLLHVDFGPMAGCEKKALLDNDLFNGTTPETGEASPVSGKGRIIDMLLPVILLIAVCVFALVYVGGIFDNKNFITAFSDTDASVALPWGALVVLVLTILYLTCRRVISGKEAMECIPRGFIAMVPAILILTLATALKNMTSMLEAREFIASAISQSAPALAQFLPAVIFIVAALLAFSTGTSWGTFGILIPIVVGIFPSDSPLLFIGMSACLAGAVCGDHCSPISDTTIMSSAGAKCDHLQHVATQLPYALTVAAVSTAGFIIAGVTRNWTAAFSSSLVLLLIILLAIKVRQKAAMHQ